MHGTTRLSTIIHNVWISLPFYDVYSILLTCSDSLCYSSWLFPTLQSLQHQNYMNTSSPCSYCRAGLGKWVGGLWEVGYLSRLTRFWISEKLIDYACVVLRIWMSLRDGKRVGEREYQSGGIFIRVEGPLKSHLYNDTLMNVVGCLICCCWT